MCRKLSHTLQFRYFDIFDFFQLTIKFCPYFSLHKKNSLTFIYNLNTDIFFAKKKNIAVHFQTNLTIRKVIKNAEKYLQSFYLIITTVNFSKYVNSIFRKKSESKTF